MGLTDYEANAYLALNSLISATAQEISLASNVPRSRIYEILKILANKGFVEISRGRPLKFNVIPPSEIFEKSKEKLIADLEEAELELTSIYESQIPNVPAPIWLIHGPQKIIKKEIEIITRAKQNLNIRAGYMFHQEPTKLRENLNKALKRNVNIKIMAAPHCITDNEKIDISHELSTLDLDIRFYQIPYVKMVIRDQNEMMLVFCKFSPDKKSVISQSAIGVWNHYKEMVENYANIFNSMWKQDLLKRA
jgi:HTH-type transcriptional regulator, sugar sensing transcriptional regulator